LIEAGASQKLPDAGAAGIVLHFENDAVCLVLLLERIEELVGASAHRAKLPAGEHRAAAAHAGLAEDRTAGAFADYKDGNDEPKRRRDKQASRRADDVDGAFPQRHWDGLNLLDAGQIAQGFGEFGGEYGGGHDQPTLIP